MLHADALTLATNLIEPMRRSCHRVEIAGSLRREKPEVKDIEIVAAPKWLTLPDVSDLFGEKTVQRNRLYWEWAENANRSGPRLQWIKPGTAEIDEYPLSEDGKYWRGYLPHAGIKLDIFLCTPENWGAIFAIRTGSADFSKALVTHAKNNCGYRFEGGNLVESATGAIVPVPEEADVFRLLDLEYLPPKDRLSQSSLRRISWRNR
jgi:DNA polymerase/3'-5' exonuclease PolX